MSVRRAALGRAHAAEETRLADRLQAAGVPWMARRSPPGQPGSSRVWWPVSASAQQPYGDVRVGRALSLSVTA